MSRAISLRPLALLLALGGLTLWFPGGEGKLVETDLDFHVDVLEGTERAGFEPHILVGPAYDGSGEWLYIDSPTGLGSAQGGNLWVSQDHGDNWAYKPRGGTSGDSYTAIGDNGEIYYSDLYLATASVDTSLDGGDNWAYNSVASDYICDDRQWLSLAPTLGGNPAADEKTLYFVFNHCTNGLVFTYAQLSQTSGVAVDWAPNPVPVSTQVSSRDAFWADPVSGRLYLPNFEAGDGLYMYTTAQGPNPLGLWSFERHLIYQEPVHAAVQNTFTAVDVDTAGNVYVMWSSREHIMLAVSQDEGATYNLVQVTQTPGTRVLPWVAAGDAGRVALIYYDTPQEGNPNNLDNATWDLKVAVSVNALDLDPTFYATSVYPAAHVGSVRTSGLDGDEGPPPDRDLGDFIGMDVDERGRAVAVFGYDGDDGANNRQTLVVFARQESGPYLREGVGPVASFSYLVDELELRVDAGDSYDQEGGDIVSYLWDWGDNTTSELDQPTTSHTYTGEGNYTVTLRVVTESGMASFTAEQLVVEAAPTSFRAYWLGGFGLLMLLAVAIVGLEKGLLGSRD